MGGETLSYFAISAFITNSAIFTMPTVYIIVGQTFYQISPLTSKGTAFREETGSTLRSSNFLITCYFGHFVYFVLHSRPGRHVVVHCIYIHALYLSR